MILYPVLRFLLAPEPLCCMDAIFIAVWRTSLLPYCGNAGGEEDFMARTRLMSPADEVDTGFTLCLPPRPH